MNRAVPCLLGLLADRSSARCPRVRLEHGSL